MLLATGAQWAARVSAVHKAWSAPSAQLRLSLQVYNPIPWAKFRNQRYAGGPLSRPGAQGRCSARTHEAGGGLASCMAADLPGRYQQAAPNRRLLAAPATAGDFSDNGEEIQIYHYKVGRGSQGVQELGCKSLAGRTLLIGKLLPSSARRNSSTLQQLPALQR